MAWTPPRRAISTATTITVNASTPSWYTESAVPKGRWTNVSLYPTPMARADQTLAGTYGEDDYFYPSRWGAGNNPFWDYTGAVYIPTLGTYGGYTMRGGGHATNLGMYDMGVYYWDVGTRLWAVHQPPTYPGTLPKGAPYFWGTTGYSQISQLPSPDYDALKLYGEVDSNLKIPAASHNRWDIIYVPPGFWGTGAGGGLGFTVGSSIHFTGSNTYAHVMDINTKVWSRVGDGGDYYGGVGGGGCIDASGNLWRRADVFAYQLQKLPHNTGTWTNTGVPNFTGNLNGRGSMAYIPGRNLVACLVGHTGFSGPSYSGYWLVIVDASNNALYIPGGHPGMSGSLPSINGQYGFHSTGIVWCDDMDALVLFAPGNLGVYKIKPPSSNYLTTQWTVTQMSSFNSPSMLRTGGSEPVEGFYNRFQYVEALRAFLIVGDATVEDMWCFRPQDSEFV